MKTKDIRKLDLKAIDKKVSELRDDIAKVQIEKFANDEKNTMKRRNLKRELAQMLTIKNEMNNQESDNQETSKAEEK